MTRAFRQFYIEENLAPGREIALPEALQHRLRTVLRGCEGMEFHLFNEKDGLYLAQLSDAKARRAKVGQQVKPPLALPEKVLLIGQPKRDAWEAVLRQATEMGVTHIIPLHTAFTVAVKVNHERAKALMVEAAEQCERLCIPHLAEPQPLNKALADWHQSHPHHVILWADERPEAGQSGAGRASGVLVGPEGGFAPDEQAWLAAQSYIKPLSLGRTILRTDTAVVAALAHLL